jgi:hypothetical protein
MCFLACFRNRYKLNKNQDSGGDLTNVQYKPIWDCHDECPLYNEHILKKN